MRLNDACINHRDLLMLGTAGRGRGEEAAIASARLENEIKPDMLLVNTMTAFEGTSLDKNIHSGKFIPPARRRPS